MISTPGIAEKGYIDVKVEVTSPGGHSSIPPDHTVSSCALLRHCGLMGTTEHRHALRVARQI